MALHRPRWSACRGRSILRTAGWARLRSRTRRSSSAGTRPSPSCWGECRGICRARACWWCRAFRARASHRCCGRGCCRHSGERAWRRRRSRRRGRAWCSPRPGRRWMSWRCGWRCWPERTRRRCGEGWTPTPTGSRSPPARPPLRRHLGRDGIRTVRQRVGISRRGCCWWSTSSSSCSLSARRRSSAGCSSPPYARPPASGTARITSPRPWSCWACALILRVAVLTTRSWPMRSRTATW